MRLRRSRSPLQSYFYFLEGLSLLARSNWDEATRIFRKAAEFDVLWGWAAADVLAAQMPENLETRAASCSSNQLVEALFLVGEAHRLLGDNSLAGQFYTCCLDPSRERAMISRLVESRAVRAH